MFQIYTSLGHNYLGQNCYSQVFIYLRKHCPVVQATALKWLFLDPTDTDCIQLPDLDCKSKH